MRSVSSKERERGGEEEARRQLEEEEEERRKQEEEKKLEGEQQEEEGEGKNKKCDDDEEECAEEEGRSLGSESYTTAASSLSYNVCKICHCGGEVVIMMSLLCSPVLVSFYQSKTYRYYHPASTLSTTRRVSQHLFKG